jgi:asparagine synthase (glutamine-hydrolysing)
MCGIAGMIALGRNRPYAPRGAVAKMADAIRHRGPDEDGSIEKPGFHLANVRLSIVGLSDGRQPIANEDESVWVVFNGELFNFREEKAFLESKGHRFRTHTDTELIPHLWEEFGVGMFDRLKGQYAFCLWDSRSHRFILARDRSGICPLYHCVRTIDGEPWLLFASEIKGLLATGFVPAVPNRRGINHLFTFFAMPGPATVFDGISTLPPGGYLDLSPGTKSVETQTKVHEHWHANYPDRGSENPGSATTVAEYETLLLAAVERRLRADVPVAAYLSGGVDSSLVVAMSNRILGRPIPTFTIAVQDEQLNEQSEAAYAAKILGCEPVYVPIGREELRRGYPELISAAEYPIIDQSCLALMELAKAVHARNYKVVLTGEGADEWLAGYPWFKLNKLLNSLDWIPGLEVGRRLRKLFVRLTRQPQYPDDAVRHLRQSVGGQNGWLDVYGLMSLNKIRFFTPEFLDFAIQNSAYDDLGLSSNINRWHPAHRELYLGWRINLPGHQLAGKADRIAMHSSVEGRYPFLDEELVDFTAKLHPRWKLRSLRKDKYIERAVAAKWLPNDIAWRKKKMFRAPFDSFATSGGDPTTAWIDELVSPDSIAKTGMFVHEAVSKQRQQLATMNGMARDGVGMGLTAVVATQLWHHLFCGGGLCSLPKWEPAAGPRSR